MTNSSVLLGMHCAATRPVIHDTDQTFQRGKVGNIQLCASVAAQMRPAAACPTERPHNHVKRPSHHKGKPDDKHPSFTRWDMKPSDKEAWDRYMIELKEYGFYRQYAMEQFAKFYFNLWW
jgi:hypothetical protein